MPGTDISFELDRFEWATPDRLEVAGRWHGVRRRLARPTLVVEVNGKPRRLQALPQSGSVTPSDWHAAFPWEGEMLKLNGAELEVGRSIVVELPRPRRSKARRAPDESSRVLAATSRSARSDSGELESARRQAADLRSRLEASQAEVAGITSRADAAESEMAALREQEAEAASLRARVDAAEAEAASLRERVEAAESEAASLRGRVESAESEAATLRGRVESAESEAPSLQSRVDAAEAEAASLQSRVDAAEAETASLQSRVDAAEAEAASLQSRVEAAESEAATLRGRVEAAEAEAASLRERLETDAAALREWAEAEQAALRERAAEDAEVARTEMAALRERAEAAASNDEAGIVAQLRSEVARLEGERNELRARLDRAGRRRDATQPMPPPEPAEEDDAPRFARRGRLTSPPPDDEPEPRFGRGVRPTTEAGIQTARRAKVDQAAGTAASDAAPATGRRPAQRTRPGRLQSAAAEDTQTGSSLVDKVSEWVSGLTASRPERETPTREPASPNGDPATRSRATARAAERTRAVPRRRRTIASDGVEDPSWLLRAIAFAMVAALLAALVIIVSAVA
jgi:predicted  nucleic acid-binding Zn-ribbon protein